MSAEYIFNRKLTPKEQAALKRMSERQANGDDSEIDYSDIPPLTDEQLASMERPARTVIAFRADRDVLDWLKSKGGNYTTRINSILRAVMEEQQKRQAS